jgi:hypothetical protein
MVNRVVVPEGASAVDGDPTAPRDRPVRDVL